MAKILSFIFLAAAIAAFVYFVFQIKKLLKAHNPGEVTYKIRGDERKLLLILSVAVGVLLSCAAIMMAIAKDFKFNVGIFFALLFGPFFFGTALTSGIGAFFLYYYKLDLDKKQRGICQYFWFIAAIIMFFGLFIFTEGIAKNESIYPLVSGFSLSSGAIRGGDSGSGFKVKFYGIFIVTGALLCYAITDHMTYQKFKKHGLIDSLFIFSFLFGILGARLWYCLVLEPDFFLHNPQVPLTYIITGMTDGGLAIQGGALLGMTAGIVFMLLFRKYIDVRFMMDVAIPTILLAQVMGRWGNFFNQEVYGAAVNEKVLWFVPTIIRENMFIDGEYRLPLFFIEGCMNLAGYFFIRYFLGKVCKFHVGLGYQASFYLVWYGMVRAILELLRDPEFRYMKSWYIAFGMMGIGFILFGIFVLIHKLRESKGLEDKFGEKIKEAK